MPHVLDDSHTSRLVSPNLPENVDNKKRCLSFLMNAYGPHVGDLQIVDDAGEEVWIYVGGKHSPDRQNWFKVEVSLHMDLKTFVLIGYKLRADGDKGDICVDDFHVVYGICRTFYAREILLTTSTYSVYIVFIYLHILF